jgi:ketosteroid isomerase-like protein
MTNAVSIELVNAFYAAYASQDTGMLAQTLHDDVTWTISGPVDVLSFCGVHRGKAAVLELVDRIVPKTYRVVDFVQDSLLVDGDRAATLNRLSGRHCADRRVVSYRLAHFLRFRDGKLTENLSLIDSFEAAEQMLGYPLEVHEDLRAEVVRLAAV